MNFAVSWKSRKFAHEIKRVIYLKAFIVMGTLIKILFSLIALVFIIPLLWLVIKEIWFFFGFSFCLGDIGGILMCVVFIAVIIWVLSNL